MKLRWKILIAVGVFLVLMAASLTVTMHVQPQNEVEVYKKMLRDKGEKLEISEVLPPPVPDESNGAALLEPAFGLIASAFEDYTNLPPAMRPVAQGKAMVGWAQPELRGWRDYMDRESYTNSWENALAANEAKEPLLELLRKAASLPVLDFKPNYQSFDPLLPHLGPLKKAALILQAATLCDIHSGDTESATTNLCVLLSLVQKEANEPIMISQKVRLAMAYIAMEATWEMLQGTNVTDLELSQLQAGWEQQEFLTGAERAIVMERAWNEHVIETLRVSLTEFSRLMKKADTDPAMTTSDYVSMGIMLRLWISEDEERMLKKDQIILDAIRSARTNHTFKSTLDAMDSRLAAMALTNSSAPLVEKLGLEDTKQGLNAMKWFFSETTFVRSNPARDFAGYEAARQVVMAAIALKRYQLKQGELPQNLSALVPDFLSSVPLDLMDGKPLRYHLSAGNNFVLYCVGDDGVDNGGDTTPLGKLINGAPNWYWRRSRDWVWPQPATAEEVQNFYDDHAARAITTNWSGPLYPATGLPLPMPAPH